ncbi:protein indeterminate-domain 1 [Iris pallida]|uniref:Protein indeterminate-domain 1 n=1 Tax=Iris pallida TaxID=29817 RepID=A0AAX6G1U8_IRIPA|nr:protein indeterminate-domain 1 [Iris pallida]
MPQPNPNPNPKEEAKQQQQQQPSGTKRKRNLPGTPDPDAEVVALSPRTLLSASTFPCEVCGKEFRRDQNLQIHRRGHNLPWKRSSSPKPPGAGAAKKVYVCPEAGCVYHEASRALGDLTGIKKHYSRKHGEKRWGCERCSKRYAVRTDWKAHARICGTRDYECSACRTLFSNKDSFVIHKASCSPPAALPNPNPNPNEEEEEEEDEDSKTKSNTNELMFPSLWGKTKSEPELAPAGGPKLARGERW